MEKNYWKSALNLLQHGMQGVFVTPTVIYKRMVPFKLLYVLHGTLQVLLNPELKLIQKVFENFSDSNENFARGTKRNLKNVEISKERFNCEILCSKFSILQAISNQSKTVYVHSVVFRINHFNSVLYCFKEDLRTFVKDFQKEKKVARSSIRILEKAGKNRLVETAEIKYCCWNGEFYAENIGKCMYLVGYDGERTITSFPIVLNSSQWQLRFAKMMHSQSTLMQSNAFCIKPNVFSLKPALKITKKRLEGYLEKFPDVITKKSMSNFFCHGYYCSIQIKMRLYVKKMVLFRKFMNLSHGLVKKTLEIMQFPMSETQFNSVFERIFEEILVSGYREKNPNKNLSQSFNDKDMVTLCPICYKIFNTAYLIEFVNLYTVLLS